MPTPEQAARYAEHIMVDAELLRESLLDVSSYIEGDEMVMLITTTSTDAPPSIQMNDSSRAGSTIWYTQ